MTRELLAEANKLNRAITNLEAQIQITADMYHCNNNLVLEVDTVGAVAIPAGGELKDDIINMVLEHLNKMKDGMEDKLRLL